HHSSTHQHSPQHSDPHPTPDNKPVGMDPAPSHSDHHRQPPAHRRGHGNGHHLLPPRRPQTTPAHRSHRPRRRDTNRHRYLGRLRHRTVVDRLVESRCPVLVRRWSGLYRQKVRRPDPGRPRHRRHHHHRIT